MIQSSHNEYHSNHQTPPLPNQHNQNVDNQLVIDHREEKIAAAKQKLKQFKKEKAAAASKNHEHDVGGGIETAAIDTINNIAANFNGSGASTTASSTTTTANFDTDLSRNLSSSSSHQQPLLVSAATHHHDMAAAPTAATMSSSRSSMSPVPSPHSSVLSKQTSGIQLPLISNMSPTELTPQQFKEQLQLHVQTIGILVAEKAELQSKLHQALKKIDKKQDECDELSGRLKASRQKISELEKHLQYQNHQVGNVENVDSDVYHQIRNELASRDLFVDEMRVRLGEASHELERKQDEIKKMAALIQELTAQLEMSQIKVQQLTAAVSHDGGDASASALLGALPNTAELDALREQNRLLAAQINEMNARRDQQASTFERTQKQIENLVDQINKLTDERENFFGQVESLQARLVAANQLNEQLKADLDSANARLNDMQQQQLQLQQQQTTKSSKSTSNDEQYIVKIDLLENEIKYFKQQIDILLKEDMQTRRMLSEKEQSLTNLEKLLREYESEREKYSTLLEQSHNDKQTISRALVQNNELKSQLAELQDAFVRVTEEKADILNRLQAEEFKVKQLQGIASMGEHESQPQPQPQHQSEEVKEVELSPDWADEGVETDKTELLGSGLSKGSHTLMDSIKQRLEYLERENKDLNDYIVLVNKQLEEREDEKRNAGNEAILIRKLREQIEGLEAEKANMFKKLDSADSSTQPTQQPQLDTTNYKLLEEKFKRVMAENADLKEKNQQLDHMVQQLQFETETIVDYITMYQMERSKLNEKYRVKDELIRSLSTQLQVNKLALIEINNCLNAYIKLMSESEKVVETETEKTTQENEASTVVTVDQHSQRKKDFLLEQIQSLLITVTSNSGAKLDVVSTAVKNEYKARQLGLAEEQKPLLNHMRDEQQQTMQPIMQPSQNELLRHAIHRFRNETVICRDCYGDLFVV